MNLVIIEAEDLLPSLDSDGNPLVPYFQMEQQAERYLGLAIDQARRLIDLTGINNVVILAQRTVRAVVRVNVGAGEPDGIEVIRLEGAALC